VDKYGCLPLWDCDCTELDMEQLDEAYLLLEILSNSLSLENYAWYRLRYTLLYPDHIYITPPKIFFETIVTAILEKCIPKDVFSGIVCK
jgi:hypothetical protein